jgi:hypothetical protein
MFPFHKALAHEAEYEEMFTSRSTLKDDVALQAMILYHSLSNIGDIVLLYGDKVKTTFGR